MVLCGVSFCCAVLCCVVFVPTNVHLLLACMHTTYALWWKREEMLFDLQREAVMLSKVQGVMFCLCSVVCSDCVSMISGG